MIRALSILAAVAALAVSAAPASAGTSKKPPQSSDGMPLESISFLKAAPRKPRGLDIGTSERLDMNARVTAKGRGAGYVANHTEGTVSVMFLHGDFSS